MYPGELFVGGVRSGLVQRVACFSVLCWLAASSLPVCGAGLYEPYRGESIAGVDTKTLTGKVMCGYQGWFSAEGDGTGLGWTHWAGNASDMFRPGDVVVDLWPDVSEYDSDELYETGFLYDDGTPAKVFSSSNRKTVLRHFEWMRDYEIDGAFVQRFANGLGGGTLTKQKNAVLTHAREAANLAGRTYAVMYDLSGLRKGGTVIVHEDWQRLRTEAKLTTDPAYLHHEGKPVVGVWGVGFRDRRRYTLGDCRELIRFLKQDGCTVMLGVPPSWEKQGYDTIDDPEFLDVLKLADIISPWAVGRFSSISGARDHAARYYADDLAWCTKHGLDYLPVAFPGFSWHNLHRGARTLAQIPRQKGRFFREQIVAAKQAGCNMLYVAMFDEVDEGTAIFKCTNTPPTGNGGQFVTYEGLPSDFYLRLTGHAGKMMRGEVPAVQELPLPLKAMVEESGMMPSP